MESANTVDIATLFAARLKYMIILQEQFSEIVMFSFTLSRSTCIPNSEAHIFLDTYALRVWTEASD